MRNKERGIPITVEISTFKSFPATSNSPRTSTRGRHKQGMHLQCMRFRLLVGRSCIKETEHTRCTAVGSSGMDTPVMAHLGDKYLMSVRVHASIYATGTEVVRVRHAMCPDPADRPRITD